MAAVSLSVLGAGSWGTALATLAAGNGVGARLWGRDREALAALAASGENARYLPGIALSAALTCEAELAAAVSDVEVVLLAVPSHAFATVLHRISPWLGSDAAIAWATKGFDPESGRFLHQLIAEQLPGRPAALITGPSFAREIAVGKPGALSVLSSDDALACRLADWLHTARLRAYTGSDVLGGELGGAMKNVLAVAAGVADGMELGLNARAALITRGLGEMLQLGHALGARPETLIGLAGLGDLVLTCTGDLSRNRRLGVALGQGQGIDEAVRRIGQVVESVLTAEAIDRLAAQHGLDLPICGAVHQLLQGAETPREAMVRLMSRERKPEYPPAGWFDRTEQLRMR